MKALNEYRTYTEIKRDMAKEGFNQINGVVFREIIDRKNWWDTCGKYIYFESNKNRNCCAVHEFGDFECHEDVADYWPYVIRAGLLLYKPKIVNSATIPAQGDELPNALVANGFKLRGQVKSNEGNYMVSLWEWWKPTRGKKK